jgi:tetratricopeptide (TPR) repeat protein
MSYRVLLWIKQIGIAAIITLFGKICVAETSLAQPLLGRIESGHKTGSIVERDLSITTVAQSPTSKAEAYGASAQQKYRKQEYQGALDDINRAIQLNPNNSFAYSWRGFLKADKFQDNRGALDDINRAIQLDPNNVSIYFMRGNLKTNKLQDISGGLSDYNRAIQLDSKNAIVYSYRGALKAGKLQDNRGALADFNRAIQLDSNCVLAYNNRAILKFEHLNDPSGGITDLQQAVRLFQQQGMEGEAKEATLLLKKWQDIQKKPNLS